MFIVAIFIVAEKWKQPPFLFLSTEEFIKNTHIYNEYHPATKLMQLKACHLHNMDGAGIH